MYDYATVTKQNQIINEIQTLNTTIETIGTTIIIIILIWLCKEFVYKILGGK